jgi:hypothetical protein
MRTQKKQEGITLLITLLLMGVLLGISTSLLNITLKQFQLSGIALASETAFQAANAGLECALYHDFPLSGFAGPFDVNGNGTPVAEELNILCMGLTSSDIEPSNNNTVVSGEEQRFQFSWGTDTEVCTEFSVYKFTSDSAPVDVVVQGVDMRPGSDCPMGSVCTVVQARGYNVACADISSGGRVVEREYTQVY